MICVETSYSVIYFEYKMYNLKQYNGKNVPGIFIHTVYIHVYGNTCVLSNKSIKKWIHTVDGLLLHAHITVHSGFNKQSNSIHLLIADNVTVLTLVTFLYLFILVCVCVCVCVWCVCVRIYLSYMDRHKAAKILNKERMSNCKRNFALVVFQSCISGRNSGSLRTIVFAKESIGSSWEKKRYSDRFNETGKILTNYHQSFFCKSLIIVQKLK